jgi:hypothetical protein
MSETEEDISLEQVESDLSGRDQKPGRNVVTVIVDKEKREVRRGRYVVAHFKRLVGVDPAYQLNQVVDGKLIELQDDAKIVIKGREVFVSQVRGGGAS